MDHPRDTWISPWWQAACIPRRFRVGGARLPPLSVWHAYALDELGNPYMVGGKATRDHALAVIVMAMHNRRRGSRLIWSPHRRARAQFRAAWLTRRRSFDALHAAVLEYVNINTRGADRWQKKGDKPGVVPLAWHLVAKLGDKAWDMPYVQARCIADALAEQNGDDSIMTRRQQEIDDNWPIYAKHPELMTAGMN